jgi:hypothetical protein
VADGHTERVDRPPPGADRDPIWSPDDVESPTGRPQSAIPPQRSALPPQSSAAQKVGSPWVQPPRGPRRPPSSRSQGSPSPPRSEVPRPGSPWALPPRVPPPPPASPPQSQPSPAITATPTGAEAPEVDRMPSRPLPAADSSTVPPGTAQHVAPPELWPARQREQRPEPPQVALTAEDFVQRRTTRVIEPVATTGIRAAISKSTRGLLTLGPGRREAAHRRDVDRVRRNFGGLRQVTVVNPKGGAGKPSPFCCSP